MLILLGTLIVVFPFFIGYKLGQTNAFVIIIDPNTGKEKKYGYWPGHEYYSFPNYDDDDE